jgi:hypothetical protein
MIERLTLHDFSGLAPGSLHIDRPDGRIPLSLAGTCELPRTPHRAAPFAVVLEGPADPLLPQGIYPLVHPVHGRLDLFLVPVARNAAYTRYEVTFN